MKYLGQIKAQNLLTAYNEDNEMVALVAACDETQQSVTILLPVEGASS